MVLTGIELIFSVEAHTVLWFGFLMNIMVIRPGMPQPGERAKLKCQGILGNPS